MADRYHKHARPLARSLVLTATISHSTNSNTNPHMFLNVPKVLYSNPKVLYYYLVNEKWFNPTLDFFSLYFYCGYCCCYCYYFTSYSASSTLHMYNQHCTFKYAKCRLINIWKMCVRAFYLLKNHLNREHICMCPMLNGCISNIAKEAEV